MKLFLNVFVVNWWVLVNPSTFLKGYKFKVGGIYIFIIREQLLNKEMEK